MRRLALLCVLALPLAVPTGCARFPELDAAQTPGVMDAPYPRLVPLEPLLNGPVPRASAADIPEVEGRVAGLRARAARLQAVQVGPGDVARRVARLRQRAAALRAE